MKKLLTATILATTIGTANAVPNVNYIGTTHTHHNYGYNAGYHDGKHDAYNNVARTAVIVGFAVIAGVIIYKLGQNSRWTSHDGKVGYRF